MLDTKKTCARCGKSYVPAYRNSGCPFCRIVDVIRQHIDAYGVARTIAEHPEIVASGQLAAMGVKCIGGEWFVPWQIMRKCKEARG